MQKLFAEAIDGMRGLINGWSALSSDSEDVKPAGVLLAVS